MRASSQDVPSLSFAPGTSPFLVKGTLWLGLRAYVDENVEGGLDRLVQFLDPPFQSFVSQFFLAAGWFDLFPILTVTRGIALARNVSFREQVVVSAAWHGEQDLKGTYRAILGQSSPQAVCRRFASIYSQLYSFGRVEFVGEEKHRIESCLHGFPEPLLPWWTKASEGYLKPILFAAGAKDMKATWLPPEPDGVTSGVPLMRQRSFFGWE